MSIAITFSSEQLERAEKLLYGIPGAVDKVTGRALNRGLEKAKTEASKQIRQRYAISTGNVKKYENVKVNRAAGGSGTEGSIEFSGPKIPLHKFKSSPATRTYTAEKIPVMVDPAQKIWRMVHKNARVSAMDAKAAGMQARPAAFIATFQSGHTGLFKRTGESTSTGRGEIKEYFGFAVADMLDYEPAREAISEQVGKTVEQRLEHEIGRILASY